MSTRCNVIVKDKFDKIWLYHHHDGYPEGVGADLVNRFKEKFEKDERIWWSDVVNTLVKDQNDEYEVTDGEHGDIEYCYTIDCGKKSICWQKVDVDWSSQDLPHTYGKKNYLIKDGKSQIKVDNKEEKKVKKNDAQLKFTMTAGILSASIAEAALREYCFKNDYELELDSHKAGLQKVFLIKVKLPYEDGDKFTQDLNKMFDE